MGESTSVRVGKPGIMTPGCPLLGQWFCGLFLCLLAGSLKVTLELVAVLPGCVSASFTFKVWRAASRRLPAALRVIFTVFLWPTESRTLVLPRTMTFLWGFDGFLLAAVMAMILPPLTVSVTVSVNVAVQLARLRPVQLTGTITVAPVTFALPSFAIAGFGRAASATANTVPVNCAIVGEDPVPSVAVTQAGGPGV